MRKINNTRMFEMKVEDTADGRVTLASRHQDDRITLGGSGEAKLDLSADRYLTVMIPLPEGYRLVTEEDKEGEKPKNWYMLLGDVENAIWDKNTSVRRSCHWDRDTPYAIPIKSDVDIKREEIMMRIKRIEVEAKQARKELAEL